MGDKRKKGPISLNSGLDNVLRGLKKGEFSKLATTAKIKTAWKEICGPQVNSHTVGAFFKNGGLTIYVDTAAWAQDLSALSEAFREAINETLHEDIVQSLSFTPSRYVEQERLRNSEEKTHDDFFLKDDVESVKLSDLQIKQLEEATSSIENEKLRQSLLKAAIANFEWKKGMRCEIEPQKPNQSD